MMQIQTLPVFSKLAEPAVVKNLIDQDLPVDLSIHQVETYQALMNPDIDVVINTAMTGDGKSLAGLLPLLIDRHSLLTLYPTNELAQDQLRSAELMLPGWKGDIRDVTQVSGPILDELLDEQTTLSRGETLLQQMKNHTLILSNPDLLHALTQFHYRQYGRAASHMVGQFSLLFDQLTFDEFHVFDTPQIIAVLTSLLFLYEQTNRPLKTLFLSATPDERLLRPLQRIGFGERLRLIDPQREGWYVHGADPGVGWRPILQGVELIFVAGQAESWIDTGIVEVLLPWFAQHGKGAKAAIIVNSVATALRLVEKLRAKLPANLRVEPNTGLNGRSTRKRSYDAEILVGTSTVDVGVDFRINLLIFEAYGAGTFMQRLGRLGRHTAYTDEHNQKHQFQHYKAVALVPQFVYDRLSKECDGKPAPLHIGDVVQRDQLSQIVNQGIFPNTTEYRQYACHWGKFQAVRVLKQLSDKSIRDSYADVRERLKKRYQLLTNVSMNATLGEWSSYVNRKEDCIIEEAQAFRGSSQFACGVLKPGEDEPLSYDLFWLLANAQVDLLSKDMFLTAAHQAGVPIRERWARYRPFFFRWHGLLKQSEPLHVTLLPQQSSWGEERFHTAQLLPGFTITGSTQACVDSLNNSLVRYPSVAILIPDFEPAEVRRTFYLTGQLLLLPYVESPAYGSRSGTIAFGRDALLLDSHLRKKHTSGGSAIIC